MKPYQIVDRVSLLYGNNYPLLSDLERVVNTEELSSIFTLASKLLGKEHRATVNALMNLVYERTEDDNVFVLFKVINAISQDEDALDALRNFMAVDTPDRQKIYLIFRVLNGLYPDDVDYLSDLKNIVCASEGEFTRDQIFLLFNVIESTLGESEVLSALKNACGSNRFVLLQTELLFRLVMSLPEPDEEILDAIKNIVAAENTPDLFLLFKVIQAIDPYNEDIGVLKSCTILKTKMLDMTDILTEGKFVIPMNLKKLVRDHASEYLTDAFSRGQLRSKLWLVDTIKELELDLGEMIYVCAGWYGVLGALLFERFDVKGSIRSFDIDDTCAFIAETLNRVYVQDGWKFKASTVDVRNLTFTGDVYESKKYNGDVETITDIAATCVINTSCEHIENFEEFWSRIPNGTLVIMQNNDFVEHEDETVVNTVSSQEEWETKLNVSELLYSGTLELEKYNRFMVIGRK
jgi:hypothetical protein